MRFLVPDLLPRLKQLADFAPVQDVRVRVAPNLTQPDGTLEAPKDSTTTAQTRKPKPPDSDSLRALADTLDDAELREALRRLAEYGD